MSSFAVQTKQTRKSQRFGESYYQRELRPWFRALVEGWTPGSNTVGRAMRRRLEIILRKGYLVQSREILGTDYRQFKQEETEPYDSAMEEIAEEVDEEYEKREQVATDLIVSTVIVNMGFAMNTAEAATEQAGRARNVIAKRSMLRRSRTHTLTIAVTEANWTTQFTRRTSILAITDPLKDSVGTIAELIEAGEENLARRVSRQITRMARLPDSVRQGTLIRFVTDNRDRLLTPETQGRIVASMRDMAERLDAPEKEWLTRGDAKVRESHQVANHQRQPADEPFILAGGRLQYPMDSSLGASLSEIINCRCAALWE